MGYLGTPIDTNNTFQSLQGKRFNGDGSTTAFTLDVAPTSTFDIEVFVENVRQDPNSAYSLSGTTLTFSAAPDSGTNNIYVVHQAKAVGTISAGAGTVNAASMDNTVISGHDALAATPADTDEFLVSDAGTIKRIDFSHLIPASLSTASGSAPSYSARAWVNFNGTGTVAIRANGNVSSITDNGTGDYTVNFATAIADTNYMVAFGGTTDSGNARRIGHVGVLSTGGGFDASGSYATGSVRVGFCIGDSGSGNGEMADSKNVDVVVFR